MSIVQCGCRVADMHAAMAVVLGLESTGEEARAIGEAVRKVACPHFLSSVF